MYFRHILGIQDIADRKLTIRNTVRAVILIDGKLLMIQTKRGDYKFPGGGMKPEETYYQAILREVKEETGYRVTKVIEKIGEIIENYDDSYEAGAVFSMTSVFYRCEASLDNFQQELDEYEKDLEFQPVFIKVEEAYLCNEELLSKDLEHKISFLPREISALKEMINCV